MQQFYNSLPFLREWRNQFAYSCDMFPERFAVWPLFWKLFDNINYFF